MIGRVLVLTVAILLLDWHVCRANVGAPYNGLGAIAGTWQRRNAAPMRYRVLAAGLLGRLPAGRGQLLAYYVFKGLLLGGALLVGEWRLGPGAALALALAAGLTLQFDYWDQYAELLGALLVLTGHPLAVAGGALLWGLSKETALLAPVLGLLAGGLLPGLLGLLGPAALLAVRWRQGRAALYCARWTLWAYNAPDLRAAWRRLDPGPLLALLWSGAAVVAAVVATYRGGWVAATAAAPLVWIIAGWTLARVRETRVFLPVVIWLVAAWGPGAV